jgi:hypothetical protein
VLAERQRRHREVGSGGSCGQSAGLTNRKRIEATHWGEMAMIIEARYLHGTVRRSSDRHKREGERARNTRGDLSACPQSDEAEAPARVATARGAGRKPSANRRGVELGAATSGRTKSEDHLREQVVERSNLRLAYQRVVQNKGAPGVDDLAVTEFKDWLKVHWPSVKHLPRWARSPVRSWLPAAWSTDDPVQFWRLPRAARSV